jgi:hypothetical protein
MGFMQSDEGMVERRKWLIYARPKPLYLKKTLSDVQNSSS